MSAFKDYCINVFSKVRPQSTFMTVNGYRNNWSEVSNFSVVFHANYLNATRKAQKIIRKAQFPYRPLFSSSDFEIARAELCDSMSATLDGFNPLYTCHGVYKEIRDADGKPIPGIKLHTRSDEVHVNALKTRKKVIVPVSYKQRDSHPKTLAKNYLRSLTPLSKWVQFKLVPRRFDELVVQRMRIEG